MNLLRIIITAIVFAVLSGPAFADDDDKTKICHKGQTIKVDDHSVNAHINNHGDTLGGCPVQRALIMLRCNNVEGLITVSGVSSSTDDDAFIQQLIIGESSCADAVATSFNEGYKLRNLNTGLTDGEIEYLFVKRI